MRVLIIYALIAVNYQFSFFSLWNWSVSRPPSETTFLFFHRLFDPFAMSQLPQLSARCWLESIHIGSLRVFIRECRLVILLIVPPYSGWEAYHVLDNAWRVLRLYEARADAVFGERLGEAKRARVAESVEAGHGIADTAHWDLLWGHGDHLLGYHVRWHHV